MVKAVFVVVKNEDRQAVIDNPKVNRQLAFVSPVINISDGPFDEQSRLLDEFFAQHPFYFSIDGNDEPLMAYYVRRWQFPEGSEDELADMPTEDIWRIEGPLKNGVLNEAILQLPYDVDFVCIRNDTYYPVFVDNKKDKNVAIFSGEECGLTVRDHGQFVAIDLRVDPEDFDNPGPDSWWHHPEEFRPAETQRY